MRAHNTLSRHGKRFGSYAYLAWEKFAAIRGERDKFDNLARYYNIRQWVKRERIGIYVCGYCHREFVAKETQVKLRGMQGQTEASPLIICGYCYTMIYEELRELEGSDDDYSL